MDINKLLIYSAFIERQNTDSRCESYSIVVLATAYHHCPSITTISELHVLKDSQSFGNEECQTSWFDEASGIFLAPTLYAQPVW